MAPLNRLLLTLFTLVLPSTTLAALWAHYIRSPDSVTAPLGDEVAFSCQTNNPVERVIWWHRSTYEPGTTPPPWVEIDALNSNPRNGSPYKIVVKAAFSKLTVEFRNETLAGEYMCVSWNGGSGLASVSGKLLMAWIADAPRLESRRISVPPGSKVLLRCPPPESEPPATILYYKMIDGAPIEEPNNPIEKNVLVHVKNETVAYTCAARNPLTEKLKEYHHRITVEVQKYPQESLPTFTPDMLHEVIGMEGRIITLGCAAIGNPVPKITWKRKDGISLPHHSESTSLFLRMTRLHIRDKGEYVCIAENKMGSVRKSVRLRVWHAAKLEPIKLDGERLKEEEIVQEGASIHLNCGRASGEPAPSFYWLINGKDVTHDESIKVLNNELEINPVEKRHAGVVQCFATNSVGSSYIAILMKVVPKQQSISAVTESGDSVYRENNSSKRIHNERHKNNPKRKIKVSLIPPSRPNVTRLSDESVMVRWSTQPLGLPIVFFKVQYRDLNASSERSSGRSDSRWNTNSHNIPANVRTYEINGLTARHIYRFRIAAVYSNDDNTQSNTSAKFLLLRGSDLLEPPPPAPIFIEAEAVNMTSIRLHWQVEEKKDPINKTAFIEGFYIYYRSMNTAGDYIKESVEGANVRSHLLANLAEGELYEIKLLSFTRSAPSSFSSIITQGTMKLNSTTPIIQVTNNESESSAGQVYGIVGGVVGGAALLVTIVLIILMCKKRRDCPPDKQDATVGVGPSGGSIDGVNGYLSSAPPTSSKPTITITTNPMHAEPSENVDMEMSYYSAQNNNCSTTPHSSVEMSATIPSSCREELRKQSPLPLPTRENYV